MYKFIQIMILYIRKESVRNNRNPQQIPLIEGHQTRHFFTVKSHENYHSDMTNYKCDLLCKVWCSLKELGKILKMDGFFCFCFVYFFSFLQIFLFIVHILMQLAEINLSLESPPPQTPKNSMSNTAGAFYHMSANTLISITHTFHTYFLTISHS